MNTRRWALSENQRWPLRVILLAAAISTLLACTTLSSDVKNLRRQANAGDAEAQNRLGLLYAKGQGAPQNYHEAAKWYRKAAGQGFADAQYNLGVMYANGQGVPQDDAESARWYRKAADQGDAGAQYNLGLMYFNGQGVPQDFVQSYFWCSLAASRASGDVNKLASDARDLAAKQLPPDKLMEAQRMATGWEKLHPLK
jgi:TPR repeat protein